MENDTLVAFFVGVAAGMVLGVLTAAILSAIKNNEELKVRQVDQPSRLQNIDWALEYYINMRSHEPYGSENYNKLTEDINKLRWERDKELARYE